MAKQRLLDKVDYYNYNDTQHLECPHCRRHSLVTHGENRYVCLNCGWERDIDNGWGSGPPPLLVILALFVVIVIITTGG